MSNVVKKAASWPPPKLDLSYDDYSSERRFNNWWAAYIEPLGSGVEVVGVFKDDGDDRLILMEHDQQATHRALLIGITEIREATADELLEELVDRTQKDQYGIQDVIEKARAYLAKKRGEK